MRAANVYGALLLPTLGLGVRIIQGNDDGWAELYVRQLHDALMAARHDAVLSCPAENKSGSGSSDAQPQPRKEPCQYNTCPANSGPVGSDPADPRLNWVNSFPVTAIKYGLDTFGPQVWGQDNKAELAVTGPNEGGNRWLQLPFSGTVGAAVEAVKQGVPAIAFSGSAGSGAGSGPQNYSVTPVPARATVYAQLATFLVDQVVAAGTPYLPPATFLNVNFPEVNDKCKTPADFKWVLTRVNVGLLSPEDVKTCNRTRLPNEFEVGLRKDCFISVSVGDAADKTTASADKQAVVLQKLGHIFTCLP